MQQGHSLLRLRQMTAHETFPSTQSHGACSSTEANTAPREEEEVRVAATSAAAAMRCNSSSGGISDMKSNLHTLPTTRRTASVRMALPSSPGAQNLTPARARRSAESFLSLAATCLLFAVLCAGLVGLWALQIYVAWRVVSTLGRGVQETLCRC